MSFIPEDELKGNGGVNLAPMIDFLFLMVVFFASLAVSRVTLRDTELELVKIKTQSSKPKEVTDTRVINVTINGDGEYKWVTEIHDYPMDSAEAIATELRTQHKKGLLPSDKKNTHVLLKIDKKTAWEKILTVVFAIKEEGFDVRPVYQPDQAES